MKTSSSKDNIFLGRKVGIELLKDIKNARKSVKIVSPYLSPSYLEELVKLKKSGVDITLVTADNLEQGESAYSSFKHSDVIKQREIVDEDKIRARRKGIVISLTVFVISLLLFVVTVVIPFLIYPFVFIMGASLISSIYFYFKKGHRYEYYSLFRIKVFDSKSGENPKSTNLIHSKVYVIDEETAYLGSANF